MRRTASSPSYVAFDDWRRHSENDRKNRPRRVVLWRMPTRPLRVGCWSRRRIGHRHRMRSRSRDLIALFSTRPIIRALADPRSPGTARRNGMPLPAHGARWRAWSRSRGRSCSGCSDGCVTKGRFARLAPEWRTESYAFALADLFQAGFWHPPWTAYWRTRRRYRWYSCAPSAHHAGGRRTARSWVVR